MNKEELKTKFSGLYAHMAGSNDVAQMRTFGDVMKRMMGWMIENKPEAAEEYIETLCAIKWRQYLTRREAETVVSDMEPKGAWDYDSWKRAMESLGLEYERETVFNSYALWVTMNAIYSDNGNVIASLMGLDFKEAAGNADYIKAIHSLAINKLLDADRKYCVRCYFLGGH